jgi:hypothetical protein
MPVPPSVSLFIAYLAGFLDIMGKKLPQKGNKKGLCLVPFFTATKRGGGGAVLIKKPGAASPPGSWFFLSRFRDKNNTKHVAKSHSVAQKKYPPYPAPLIFSCRPLLPDIHYAMYYTQRAPRISQGQFFFFNPVWDALGSPPTKAGREGAVQNIQCRVFSSICSTRFWGRASIWG